jgi:small subunit ribosomal protein S20
MAHHKSAQKRIRQTARRTARNRDVRSHTRTLVKKFQKALEAGDAEAAGQQLRLAEGAIRRAATKGIIPARRASRTVSRLSKSLKTISAPS